MQPSLLTLLLISSCILLAYADPPKRCKKIVEAESCSSSNYEAYMECMKRRTKRSIDCEECDGDDCEEEEEVCSNCDCNYCSYNDCDSSCNSCCANVPPPCSTRSCCQNTCHSQCRTVSCRRNCRSKCHTRIKQTRYPSSSSSLVGTGSGSTGSANSQSNLKSDDKHNITTVINLHNVINNTNVVDIPVHVNNTNVNNITVESAEMQPSSIAITTHGSNQQQQPPILYPQPPPVPQPPSVPPQWQPPPPPPEQHQPPPVQQVPPQSNCCKVIGPRQCVPSSKPPFVSCYHYRTTQCGDICQAAIMHAEPHQVCDRQSAQTSCHQQVAYIPQPQPRCSYTSAWPYVSCSAPNLAQPNCGGCYKHLLNGGSVPSGCSSSCYDGGYDVGPMYRFGPVYQPPVSAYPPCMYTGTCGMMGAVAQENPFDGVMQVEPNRDIQNKRNIIEESKKEEVDENAKEQKKELKKIEENTV